MIRHIVFFNSKRPEDSEAIYRGLSALKAIPHHLHFEVGRNLQADQITEDVPEFVVYGEFADEAQLAAYKAHSIYQEAIEIVRPLREMRIAADFVSDQET